MPTPRSTSPTTLAAPHEHSDRCEVCGGGVEIERKYPVTDRVARALFAAICRSMNLEPTAASKRPGAPIYVRAPDAATHERLWARYRELMPALDDRVLAVTADFIRENTGIVTPIAPRR